MPRRLRIALPWAWTGLIGLLVVVVVTSLEDLNGITDYAFAATPILLTALAAAIFNRNLGLGAAVNMRPPCNGPVTA